jgi:glyoxylase-like metal-dependent hydrolase (beta-lactamase superfamily II)
VVTPGHTRAHQAVLLSEQGWQGLYVSDMATFTVHLTNSAWMTAFDVLPLESIRTKRRWQRWALERDAWLMFLHDPILPVGRLVMQDGRLQMSSIPEAETLIDLLPTQPPLRE